MKIRVVYAWMGFALSMFSTSTFAQHNIVYSQYIFNGLLINPAYAGSHVELSAALSYRNQWVNFEGAPQTTTFGAHSSFNREKVGLGLLVTSDKIGSYSNTGLFASYAYRIKRPDGGVFSMGIQAGFNNFKADFSELRIRADQDPIFVNAFNELRPNFGGGIFYYNNKYFVGFSVPVLLTHKEFFSGQLQQLAQPRFYYLHAGTIMALNRTETVKLSPSFLLRVQDGTPLSADINLNLIFYDIISVGTSYRLGDAVNAFVNFKLSNKFHFSYSYDFTLSDIGTYSRGTHEVMLTYRTWIKGVHKDIECPYFFNH